MATDCHEFHWLLFPNLNRPAYVADMANREDEDESLYGGLLHTLTNLTLLTMKLPLRLVNRKMFDIVRLFSGCGTGSKKKTLSFSEADPQNRNPFLPGLAKGVAQLRRVETVERFASSTGAHRARVSCRWLSSAEQQQTLVGEYTQEGRSL